MLEIEEFVLINGLGSVKRKKGVEPSAFALARQRSTTELLTPGEEAFCQCLIRKAFVYKHVSRLFSVSYATSRTEMGLSFDLLLGGLPLFPVYGP